MRTPADLHASTAVVDGCSWTFDGWTDKVAQSGVAALNLTVVGAGTDFYDAIRSIEQVLQVVHDDPERLCLARTVADILRMKARGGVAVVLNFQNGQPLETSLHHLHFFWEIGVRNIQLTYNERNCIGDGCLEPANAGLSTFGRRLVGEMNRLGIVVDLAHVGERTSLEAIDASAQPCVFSHSNPRRLAESPRNITDEQIKACTRRGGVVGVCGWGPVLWTRGDKPPGLDDFVADIEYLADLAGVDHVAVATDSTTSMRTDHILQHAAEINAAYPRVTGEFVARFGNGLEHRYPVSVASLPQVTQRLQDKGWKAEDVTKIMGGNFLRVWQAVWGA